MNEAIADVATQAKLFKDSMVIPLVCGQEIYNLPDNILELSHCTYNWLPLPLRTSGYMNHHREPDWRYTITNQDITMAVFDEFKRRQIRVYPRPFGDYTANLAEFDSYYGVTTAISGYEVTPAYGVVSTLCDPEVNSESLNSLYGVLVNLATVKGFVIYYTYCPDKVTGIEQDVPIDECFDTALKHYVISLALRNDLDVTNRSLANEEMVFYDRALDVVKELASTDSVSARDFETAYNPMG